MFLDCSFNSLAIAISECSTHADVLDKWKELAKHLNTDEVKKRELQQNLNLGTKKIKCIPYELMIEWRSINGKAATLERFCEALKATGLNSTATNLLEHFVPTKMVDSEKSTSSTESACASAITSLKKEDDIPITEEGRRLKEYVQYYIIDLIEMTDLSDDLIRVMTDNGVLEDKDIENIVSVYAQHQLLCQMMP